MPEKCNVDNKTEHDLQRLLMEPDYWFRGRVKGSFEIFYEGSVPYSFDLRHLNSRLAISGIQATKINKYGEGGKDQSYYGYFECPSVYSLFFSLEYIRRYSVYRGAKPTNLDLKFENLDNSCVKPSD